MEGEDSGKGSRSRRRVWARIAGSLLAGLLVYWAVSVVEEGRGSFASTEDAFLSAHVVRISPKVSGYLERLLIDDNTRVSQGQLLGLIDPRDYQARVAVADAVRLFAGTEWFRMHRLVIAHATPELNLDTAVAVTATTEAALRLEKLSLGASEIRAPVSGKISGRRVDQGSYVASGQFLFSIVPEGVWVNANFRERDLGHIHPGMPAEIRLWAQPGRLYHGHVESIQRGTKSALSLYPPLDMRLNYVKPEQRIPIKILFDEPLSATGELGPWMTAAVRIPTGAAESASTWALILGIGAAVAVFVFVPFGLRPAPRK
ncbi:putative multidrug resistance protein EmrK [Methylacidimicrobium cyclopophantes]|uniref:Multidrug resistance protein EmrK n=1 Tax=Methylacidimicrobium cyclopophantes TaxID=1041766 RepID=A0A5E6ME12_9BACT|nr:HlyD family secretion protein [Methylacidimicrobium cyclopophantes]VVM07343.1 putative multidrug resistance protein EmrK [Methylacidimicrobium cyclopophantes]